MLLKTRRGRRPGLVSLRTIVYCAGLCAGLAGGAAPACAGALARGLASTSGGEHAGWGGTTSNEPPVDEASVLAPAIVEQPQSPRRLRWFGRASFGAAYRWAFDESMLGVALEGELGGHDPRLAGGMRLRIEAGKMLADLAYQVVSLGPFIWLPAVGERLRIGFGVDAGALLISRRTMPGNTLWSVLMGGQLRLSVDLLHIGPSGALQADAGLAIQALTAAPGPLTVATTLGFGYRP